MVDLAHRLYNTAYVAWHAQDQGRYPFRSLSVILADQSRRVQAIVAHAYQYVPYYRETLRRLGLTPADLRSAADLARLPILEREQIQRDPLYYVSTAHPLDYYKEMRTSGSSGQPCVYYRDPASLFLGAAMGERGRSIIGTVIGQRLGYRKAMVYRTSGNACWLQTFWAQHLFLPADAGFQRQYLSLNAPLDENLARINEFRPALLDCFWLVCRHAVLACAQGGRALLSASSSLYW